MSDARDAGRLTLFCFPCAGASATRYLRWRRRVPSWLRIEPVEPPGRGLRMGETLLRDYGAVVADLSAGLAPRTAARYALFGHSMGALLAYGCARRLLRDGARAPVALVVAGAAAPSRRLPRPERKKSEEELIHDLRRLEGAPEALFEDEEMLRMTLDILAADYDVCDSFGTEARPPLPMPIFIYGGTRDSVQEPQLAAWGVESAVRSDLAMFEGGHFFIQDREDEFLARMAHDLEPLTETRFASGGR